MQTAGFGNFGRFLANDTELHPQAPGANSDRLFSDGWDQLRLAKDVYRVDGIRDLRQRGVGLVPENHVLTRIDRDDLVATNLQVAPDKVAGS